MGSPEQLLPGELCMYIFSWVSFCTLLKTEAIYNDFKKWIHAMNGPHTKFQSIIFELLMAQEILAAVMRSGPELDRDRLRKSSAFTIFWECAVYWNNCTCAIAVGWYPEAIISYQHLWIKLFCHRTFSTISWQGEETCNNNLAELLSFYSNTVTEVEVMVWEDAVSFYNVLCRCKALKMLKICSKSWGFSGDDQKSNVVIVVLFIVVSIT